MAQGVKNLPATQETQKTQIQSLGWEDPLKEEVETHSSSLAWKILWREEPGFKELDMTEHISTNFIY